MYLQASPKVKCSNPLQHTAMEMGVWLGLIKQKRFFFRVLYIQACLCDTEVCVLNSSIYNKRKNKLAFSHNNFFAKSDCT